MKVLLKKIILTFSAVVLFAAIQASKNDWEAPKSADAVKNPFANNADASAQGKILFNQKCASCHGTKGKGDGIAGIALNPRPKDLCNPAVQEQTDGAIFWKITNGKSPMASYQVILKDEQRWQLVNYIRELGKCYPEIKK
jgi:mono/diheme cytochrome c family protein